MRKFKAGASSYGRLALLSLMLLVAVVQYVPAANWYVTPSAQGSDTGMSWSNSWSLSTMVWSNVHAGDTVWLAGGTYSSGLTVTASGSAGSPILIERAASTNSSATSSPGWSSSYDSMVTLPSIDLPGNNYVSIVGQSTATIPYGILVEPSADQVTMGPGNLGHIKIVNVQLSGAVGDYGVYFEVPAKSKYINFSNDWFHQMDEAFSVVNISDSVIQHSIISNMQEGNPHADVMYIASNVTNFTMRYNIINDSPNDGIFFQTYLFNGFYFYGNLYVNSYGPLISDGTPGATDPYGNKCTGATLLYIYNNVFYNTAESLGGLNGTVQNCAGYVYDNVFWNVIDNNGGGTGPVYDRNNAYNPWYYGGYPLPSGETGFVQLNSNPFVNPIADTVGNFNLLAQSPLGNSGVAITAVAGQTFNIDPAGNTRSSGNWAIGAYQYTGAVTTTTSVSTTSTSSVSTTTMTTTSTATTTSVSTTIPPSTVHYVLITLANSGSATSLPFQDMISFNPSTYSSYEAADLGNIRFYIGTDTGTQIRSWCESGCTSSSSNAVIWLKLPNGIGANSNVVVNMTFQATSVEYDGAYAGEAPQLSTTFGRYDNGKSVFNIYSNSNLFASSSAPGGWVATPSCEVSGYYCIYNASAVALPGVVDSYGRFLSGSGTYIDIPFLQNSGASAFGGIGNNAGTSSIYIRDYNNGAVATLTSYNTNNNIYTYRAVSSSSESAQFNYGTAVTDTYSLGSSSLYAGIFGPLNSAATVWFRERAYPPSGVMPTQSFGPVQLQGSSTTTTSVSTTSTTTISSGNTCTAPSGNHCWYVDPTATGGTTAGTSWANAWTSLSSVTSTYVKPGDTVYISGGSVSQTYTVPWVTGPPGGSAGKPVTYAVGQDAGHNGVVVFQKGSASNFLSLQGNNCISYLTFNGSYNGHRHMNVTGFVTGNNYGLYSDPSCTNTTLVYMNFIDTALYMGGEGYVTIAHDYVSGNIDVTNQRVIQGGASYVPVYIYDNIIYVPISSQGAGGNDGIGGVATGIIYNNTIINYRNASWAGWAGGTQHPDGIQTEYAQHLKIYDNVVINPGNSCMVIDPNAAILISYVQIYNNLCYSVNSSGWGTAEGVGIGVNGAGGSGSTFSNILMCNNLNYNTGGGGVGDNGYSATFSNVTVCNNVASNAGWAIGVSSGSTASGIYSSNNIMVSTTNPGYVAFNPPYGPWNFNLTSSATSLIQKGTNEYSTFTTDAAGRQRPASGNWDIGPYQYTGAVTTTTSTSTTSTSTTSVTTTIFPLTVPTKPTVSAIAVDKGQLVAFQTYVTNGIPPYAYNFIVSNAGTGAMVLSSYLQSSNSFSFATSATGTFVANVFVTDNEPLTKNSVYSSTFGVNPDPTATALTPSNSVIVPGQGITFNVVIALGTGLFTLKLTTDGIAVNTIVGASDGTITFNTVYPGFNPTIYNVIGTDMGTTPQFTFTSTTNSVTVVGGSTSTTTTSTSTLSTTSTVGPTTTASQQTGSGPSAGSGPSSGSGTQLPTVTYSASCFTISNMTQDKAANGTLNRTFVNIRVNFIGPGTAGITVNDNASYTLFPYAPQSLFNQSGYSYTAELTNITYVPIQHTIEVSVCSTSAASLNSSTTPILIVNNSGTVTSTPMTFDMGATNIGFWPGKVSVSVPLGTANSVYLSLRNAVIIPTPPPNYTRAVTFNLSVSSESNVSILVTLAYNCSLDASRVVPFILDDGAWRVATPFTTRPDLCTISFPVPSDPVIGLMVMNQTSVASTTTIESVALKESGKGISAYAIAGIVAAVVIIAVLFEIYRIRKGKPTISVPHQDSAQPSQPIAN